MQVDVLQSVAIEDLPVSLADLVTLIGLNATLNLVKHWGGITLYVPANMQPSHIIARRIGYTAASKLASVFALNEIQVPKAERALRRARNRLIRERHKAPYSHSAARLARDFYLTERQVFAILADDDRPIDTNQQSLF